MPSYSQEAYNLEIINVMFPWEMGMLYNVKEGALEYARSH